MGFDTPGQASNADGADKALLNTTTQHDGVLAHLQASAGLQDKIGDSNNDKLIKAGKAMFEVGAGLGSLDKIAYEQSPPSDKERVEAEKTLEGRMSKLIPPGDREAMKAMTTAITNGDTKAFAEAVKKAGRRSRKTKSTGCRSR